VAHVVTGSFHSSSHNLLQWFNWLPVEYHVNFRISNITFHTLYSSQPAYQLSALCARHSTCCLRLSHTNLFSIPYVRTSFGARSFNVAAPAIWNSLPSAPICVPALTSSAITSRAHYFQQAFQPTYHLPLAPHIQLRLTVVHI